jgi:hypothetical protein
MTMQISNSLRNSTLVKSGLLLGHTDHDVLTKDKFHTNVKNLNKKIWHNSWGGEIKALVTESEIVDASVRESLLSRFSSQLPARK